MNATEKVINDLNVAIFMLGNTQITLNYELRIRIGQAITSAIDMLNAQPRWISVEEKLPEDPGDYLVYDGSNVQFCKYYCSTWNTPDYYESDTIECVTHWMPLPKPPEGE